MTALDPRAAAALAELRVLTAYWLDKAGMTGQATTLRELPPVRDTAVALAAADVVRPMMQAAYRRAGVTAWPDAQRGIDVVTVGGGLGAKLDACRPYPPPMLPGLRDEGSGVRMLAGWLHTTACYAAHAATEPTEVPAV